MKPGFYLFFLFHKTKENKGVFTYKKNPLTNKIICFFFHINLESLQIRTLSYHVIYMSCRYIKKEKPNINLQHNLKKKHKS
ncbi:hypothetical protein B0A80_10745 [Flavobacterium tructae]|nr:hypothetical protein B0A80_10745 [Flavobacterium tructae]